MLGGSYWQRLAKMSNSMDRDLGPGLVYAEGTCQQWGENQPFPEKRVQRRPGHPLQTAASCQGDLTGLPLPAQSDCVTKLDLSSHAPPPPPELFFLPSE